MSSASRIIVIVTTLTILGLVGFAYGTSELQDIESHFTDFEVNKEKIADDDQVPALSSRHKRQLPVTSPRCKSRCYGAYQRKRLLITRRPRLRNGWQLQRELYNEYFDCILRCQATVTCETLPSSIPNADLVVVTGNRPGDIADYECSSGFIPKGGPSPRICLEDGKWSGTAVTCISVTK